MPNPFAVLGLAPSALKGLDDEQILELVKKVYLAQVSLHHPDQGGSCARTVELNDAYAVLSGKGQDEEGRDFAALKKEFLRSTKSRKYEEAQSQIEQLRRALSDKEKQIEDFWLVWANFKRPEIALGSSGSCTNFFSLKELPDLRMILVGGMTASFNMKGGGYVESARAHYSFCYGPQRGAAYTLFSRNGRLFRQDIEKVACRSESELPPGLPKSWFFSATPSYFFQPYGEPVPVDMEIIGSLANSVDLDFSATMSRSLLPDLSQSTFEQAQNGYRPENFRPMFKYLWPLIGQYVWPVMLRKTESGPRFFVSGNVIRIEKV